MTDRNWQNWDTNGAAERIDEYWQNGEGGWRASLAAELKKHLDSTQPIIEIGCGSGLIYQALAHAGLCTATSYTGGDISQSMLTIARQRFPDVRFETLDIFKLALADMSQPVVLNVHVMQHLPHYSEAMTELLRVAKNTLIVICWFHQGAEDEIIFSEPSDNWGGQRFYNNCYSLPGFVNFLQGHATRIKDVAITNLVIKPFGDRNYLIKIELK